MGRSAAEAEPKGLPGPVVALEAEEEVVEVEDEEEQAEAAEAARLWWWNKCGSREEGYFDSGWTLTAGGGATKEGGAVSTSEELKQSTKSSQGLL